jgi:hypothetical protein
MKTLKHTATDFRTDRFVSDVVKLCSSMAADSHAVGIIYCDSSIDCAELMAELSHALRFPVIGGTVMSFFNDGQTALFTLLYGDDVYFSADVVDIPESELDNCQEITRTLYKRCLDALPSEPKLIIPFIPSDTRQQSADMCALEVFALAGDVPVFGAVHANDLLGGNSGVFGGGISTSSGIGLLMIAGNIRPIFAHKAEVTPMSEYAPLVTHAEGNKLYEVDGGSFCQYAQKLGLDMSLTGEDYVPHGLLRFEEADIPPELAQLRAITGVASDLSHVTFSSLAPLQARVNVALMSKDNVARSTKACVADIKQKIALNELDGYKYSFINCISCVSRYFTYIGSENYEKGLVKSELPTAASYYAFGEIGPVQLENKLTNRLNNISIVICAI